MNRRNFIKHTGLAVAGLAGMPYILPAARLNAPTGTRIANHVVYCLFAGGIRNFESLDKAEGNLLPNLLPGNETISKDIAAGIDALPPPVNTKPIQQYGTLYKNFRYRSKDTVHYDAHAAAIMGVYSTSTPLMKPLNYPSVFEYYRKHNTPSMPASSAWWIADQAGPFSFLNYSDYPGYGPMYGANILQPTSYFNTLLDRQHNFTHEEEDNIAQLQAFFNQHAPIDRQKLTPAQIENTYEDRKRIHQLLNELNTEYLQEGFNPWQTGKAVNDDILTMYAATRVLTTFKPELLVVNMQHSDIGHSDFTKYCNNMRKADYALGQLWRTIQSTPGLADDTILIAAPEFGRNLKPNTIIDKYGRHAVDHTGDENSQKIFCMVAGPPKLVKQNQVITEVKGETIDIVPTIARILGFEEKLPRDIIQGKFLEEAFN
jgi:hypothetical protein